MESFWAWLHRLGVGVSRLLDPIVPALDWLDATFRRDLDNAGVPLRWQPWAETAIWVLALVAVVRFLSGWVRLLVLTLALLVWARAYDVLAGG